MGNRKILIALGLLAMWPAAAAANVPVPTLFGPLAPLYLTGRTTGLAFLAILLIEFFVLWALLRGRWQPILRFVVLANLASSAAGFLLAGSPTCLLGIFILPLLLAATLRPAGHPIEPKVVQAVVLGAGLLLLAWVVVSFNRGDQLFWLYFSLVPAFFLTVAVEYALFGLSTSARRCILCVAAANAASYALLVGLLTLFTFRPVDNPLLSTAYIRMHVVPMVERGEYDRAQELLQRLDEITELDDPYGAYGDARFARDMAKMGAIELARERLARLDQYTDLEGSPREEDIIGYRAEAEELLQRATARGGE